MKIFCTSLNNECLVVLETFLALVQLMHDLYNYVIYAVGTVSRQRTGLPGTPKNKNKMSSGSHTYSMEETAAAIQWQNKKLVNT